jgi:hypothetical protein
MVNHLRLSRRDLTQVSRDTVTGARSRADKDEAARGPRLADSELAVALEDGEAR